MTNLGSRIIRGRPRLFIGVAAGLLGWLVLRTSPFQPLTQIILAWDIGCIVFLTLVTILFCTQTTLHMETDAARQEEGEWTLFLLTIGAAVASFVAIIGQFSEMKAVTDHVHNWHVILVAVTLLLSWLVTHTLFAMRYAHEYYSHTPGCSDIDRGLDFPGETNPDYWDFVYFALVVGMTFQVSDVEITSRRLRRVATLQGLIGFLNNTIIIALTVNIASAFL